MSPFSRGSCRSRYLSGNFAPVHQTQALTPCSYSGTLPEELAGGQYVRNGGNPVTNENLGRDAHWFDGDGMLSGVSFRRTEKGCIQPEFVNQYILTDVYLSSKTSKFLKTPILPSIATLVNPMSSLVTVLLRIFRTLVLVLLSHLPGSQQAIKKISVANTAVLYHDGRALATCESGPPMRIALPGLETVGWFNGRHSENEAAKEDGPLLGGSGIFSFLREFTTAHPRVDPVTLEMLLYHSTFVPPYVQISVLPSRNNVNSEQISRKQTTILNETVPGIESAKMMHDFGVTSTHTIIMDLPLSLDPLNLAKNKPVVEYDPTGCSRFGIFPRHRPELVRWFTTHPCCIFHTANSWNSLSSKADSDTEQIETVNMLACRLTSASLVFSAGDLAAPQLTHSIKPKQSEEEQCRLYYYQFSLDASSGENRILHQWALSTVPFEFPSVRASVLMADAQYVYGCSVDGGSFGAALGRAVKINSLVKMNVRELIRRGKVKRPQEIRGSVDTRTMSEVVASSDPEDPISVFRMPEGWYAQEPRFVPRLDGGSEDEGWLLTYVFNEMQLEVNDECPSDAKSELWVIDAVNMRDVVAKVKLPQRVPYGLHGTWFPEQEVLGQRELEQMRSLSLVIRGGNNDTLLFKVWLAIRKWIEAVIA